MKKKQQIWKRARWTIIGGFGREQDMAYLYHDRSDEAHYIHVMGI